MIYPEDFKNRMLKAYPNSLEVTEYLKVSNEENLLMLCHFLQENSSNKISIDFILEANSLEELQKIAKIEKERCLLHQEALKLFYSTFAPENTSENG